MLSLQEKLISSGGVIALGSALFVFLAQCSPFRSVFSGLSKTSQPPQEGETVRNVRANVRAMSDVNDWTEVSDEELIKRVLEKLNGLHPLVEENKSNPCILQIRSFAKFEPAGIRLLLLDYANTH